MRSNLLAMFAAFCTALSGAGTALAQADKYPSRPIQVVVPLSPGTTTDIVARMFAERLAQRLGQPVLVQNRQGAGGTIAAQSVAKAAPDGYTILMVNSQHTINPSMYAALPYDTLRDFASLAMVGEAPSLVVVTPQLGVRSLRDFIALAKQRPDTIHYASSGVGSQTHLAGAYFAGQTGIRLVHVPYKNSADVVADLLGNRVQAAFVPAAFLQAFIRDGKLLALAVGAREAMRTPLEVPSAGGDGAPGYEFGTWFGFLAPARVPASIREQLAGALMAITQDKNLREKLFEQGIVPQSLGSREFDAYIKSDLEKLAAVAKAAGIKAE